MDRLPFAQLASQAQNGDKTALEQLLIQAYGPVSYLCRKLLQNDRAEEAMTREILLSVRSRLHTLKDPEHFEKWLVMLAARHCLRRLKQNPPEKSAARKKLEIPSADLDTQQTVTVVDRIVDALPDGPRTCMILSCCGRLPVSRIAHLTGFAEPDAEAHLNQAKSMVSGSLKKLSRQGVQFPPIPSLPEILSMAMYRPCEPKTAQAMVSSILKTQAPKAAPVPPRRSRAKSLWIAVAASAVLLLLMAGTIFALESKRQAEPLPVETTAAAETTHAETEATTIPTTVAETTVETTQETTVPTTAPETTAATTEAATEPATQPAVKPAAAPQVQPTQSTQPAPSEGSASSAAGSTASGNGSAASGNGSSHVHSYQDAGPIGTQSAGCESPGTRTKICFVCGDTVRYSDPATMPALGHSYSSTVKPPTTSREGYTVHTCTRCGSTYMDNYVPKLPEETQPPATQAAAPSEEIPEAPPAT